MEEAERLKALRSLLSASAAQQEEENGHGSDVKTDSKENEDERLRLLRLREALGDHAQKRDARLSTSSLPTKASAAKSDASNSSELNHAPAITQSSPANGTRSTVPPSNNIPNHGEASFHSDGDHNSMNGSMLSNDGNSVFERLYAQRKPRNSDEGVNRNQFKPKIDPKSRQLATSQGERVSLYERALQRQYRLETTRELLKRQEREDRSRSRILHSSQELAWNKLKREIEQLFAARLQANQPEGQAADEEAVLALDQEMFGDVLKHLNLHEVKDELFALLARNGNEVGLEAFISFIKHVSFPSRDEEENPEDQFDPEFVARVKRLLIGRKAIPSTASLEKVFREVMAETPFSPQITERSRVLDQKRFEKLGIDANLPRSEKIHQELKVQAERKQSLRTRYEKQELAQCTFKPKTTKFNPSLTAGTGASSTPSPRTSSVSSQDGDGEKRPLDVGSRLYRESIERKHRLMAKAADRMNKTQSEIAAECTFKPQTNTGKKRTSSEHALVVLDTPFRARAFENSVGRLRAWREKHVEHEDLLDVGRQPKPQKSRAHSHQPRIAREAREIIFEAEVNLPNGDVQQIQVREGDNVKRVAYLFARRHDLSKQAETALAESLAEGLQNMYGENEEGGEDEYAMFAQRTDASFSTTESSIMEPQEDNAVFIDILVRAGETYTLRLMENDDPEQVAMDFAAQVGMDDDARETLIESLRSLRV